jgi:hypothetical protein
MASAFVQAQIDAATASKPAGKGKTGKQGERGTSADKTQQEREGYDTPPEPVAPKYAPVRWEVAQGEHSRQYPGRFRVVVSGHESDLPAVLQALEQLTQP